MHANKENPDFYMQVHNTFHWRMYCSHLQRHLCRLCNGYL